MVVDLNGKFLIDRQEWINIKRKKHAELIDRMKKTENDLRAIIDFDFDNVEGDGFDKEFTEAEVTLAKRRLQETLFWLNEGIRKTTDKLGQKDIYFKL